MLASSNFEGKSEMGPCMRMFKCFQHLTAFLFYSRWHSLKAKICNCFWRRCYWYNYFARWSEELGETRHVCLKVSCDTSRSQTSFLVQANLQTLERIYICSWLKVCSTEHCSAFSSRARAFVARNSARLSRWNSKETSKHHQNAEMICASRILRCFQQVYPTIEVLAGSHNAKKDWHWNWSNFLLRFVFPRQVLFVKAWIRLRPVDVYSSWRVQAYVQRVAFVCKAHALRAIANLSFNCQALIYSYEKEPLLLFSL